MRIGIVGGGSAGLTTAWLLAGHHDVTLFEAQPRLGGHAHTVMVDDEGTSVAVEAGFEFFSQRMWPTWNRLLAELRVPLRAHPTRLAVYRKGHAETTVFQPTDVYGRFVPAMLSPRRVLGLAQYGLLLASVGPLMRARDTSVTLGTALSRVPLTKTFRDEFLIPFLLGNWCVEPEELLEFSAYNALRYSYMGITLRGAVDMQEVVGGLTQYVAAMASQLSSANLRTSAGIARVERNARGFTVHEHDARSHELDHLVLATNARDAAKLLAGVPGAERARELLSSIDYFRTTIAVHGDPRRMPARERDWSIVNVCYDGRHSQATVWKPWRSPRVFRSWLTYSEELPERMHALVHFDHAKVTPSYFRIQRELGTLQGRDQLWLAGVHMHDVDSHESAVCSALNVVQKLAPDAPRLSKLL
jgi:predicted NAD/FAD-binding protein